MPEEFDPSWEYFVPSQEMIEAATEMELTDGEVILCFCAEDHKGSLCPTGVRFCKPRHLDNPYIREAPLRQYSTRAITRRPKPQLLPRGRPRKRQDRHCAQCGKSFYPRYDTHLWCSQACWSVEHRPKGMARLGTAGPRANRRGVPTRGCTPPRELVDLACRMYRDGEKMAAIARAVGVKAYQTVQRWLRGNGVVLRDPYRPSKYMLFKHQQRRLARAHQPAHQDQLPAAPVLHDGRPEGQPQPPRLAAV